MSRRSPIVLLAGFISLLLAGCAQIGGIQQSDSVRIGELLFHAITGIGSPESVPRSRVAAVPYASLGVRLGSSDQSMFVLASKSGDDLVWLGGAQLAITTRNGRIVRTAGFVRNLSGFQAGAKLPAPADGSANTRNYLYDFADRSWYGIAVSCSTQNLGSERIEIIGVPHETSHWAEDCVAPQIGWNFRNEFWRDSGGFVWKSRQYVAPGLDPFTLDILRQAE